MVNSGALVLFDPNGQYQRLERIYDAQLFKRCTDKGRCVLHVLSTLRTVRLLDLFLPDAEHSLIGGRVLLFKNTVFHIYCKTSAIISEMERRYNIPVFVKIFHIDWLETHLQQAALGHLNDYAERTQHEPDEYDVALQAASEIAMTLANDLRQHMITKLGEQPE